MADDDLGLLERDLIDLGRALRTPPPAGDLVEAVLARVSPASASPTPAAPVRAARRRLAWAIAAMTILIGALIPPVRAAVLDLFRIGGVTVRHIPTPTGSAPGAWPSATSTASPRSAASRTPVSCVAAAAAAVGVDIAVPRSLGAPDSVAVTHGGKVAELTWSDGPVRLDVFAGVPDWGYLKSIHDQVQWVDVNGHSAIWIAAPHQLQWIDRSGAGATEPVRTAGPTLVWVVPDGAGEVTYRVEGMPSLARALAVAKSAG